MTNSFFACVAYMILVADFLQKALEGLFGWSEAPRPLLIWASTLSVTLPLSHARNLSALRYTSMLGLAIIGFVIIYVVSDCVRQPEVARINLQAQLARFDMGLFSTLALCTGAFQAHYNAPKIFGELGCDLQKHTRVVAASFGTAFLIYSSFAVAGLGLFGEDLLGNVLRNYPAEGNKAVLMAWLGMAVAIVFTYPLVFTTGRDSLVTAVPALQRAGKTSPTASHVALTSSLVALISSVSCCVEDVSLVTGLLGATIGACLCWIFPACIYLKVRATDAGSLGAALLPSKRRQTVQGSTTLACYAVGMVIVGFSSMCVGIGKTLGLF